MTSFSLSKKFIAGEANFSMWRTLSKVVGLFSTLLIIKSLTIYQYGVFQLLLALYALAVGILAIGGNVITNDIQRYIGEGKEREAKRLFFEYTLLRGAAGVLLFVFFYFGAPLLAFKYKVDFINFFRILAFLFLADTLIGSMNTLLQARLEFRVAAMRNTVHKLVQFAILAGLFLSSAIETRFILISMVAAAFASTIFMVPALIRSYGPWRALVACDAALLSRVFVSYGKWSLLQGVVGKSVHNVQPWLVKAFISTEAVAIYNVALALADALKGFIFTNTLNTLVARLAQSTDRMRPVFTHGVKFLTYFSVLLALLSALGGTVIVHLLFPQYSAALPFFYLLLVGYPVTAWDRMVDVFLNVMRKQKFFFFRIVWKNLAILATLLALLPLIGLWALPAVQITLSLVAVAVSYRYLIVVQPRFALSLHTFFRMTDEDRMYIKTLRRDFFELIRVRLHSLKLL